MDMNMPEVLEVTQSLLSQIANMGGEEPVGVPRFLMEQLELAAKDAKAEIKCKFCYAKDI